MRIIDLAGLENGNMRSYEDMKLHLLLWCFMEWDNCAVRVPLEDHVLGFTIKLDYLPGVGYTPLNITIISIEPCIPIARRSTPTIYGDWMSQIFQV